MGQYLIFNPVGGQDGGGAFAPNGRIRERDFTDGLSNTIGMAEVKAFQPRVQDAVLPSASPTVPQSLAGLVSGGAYAALGHTEWVCGRAVHTGFTTQFGPNTRVPFSVNGQEVDVDFSSSREGNSPTLPTLAVITSRSFHTGMVNALLMDGSVRSITSNLDLSTWQRLGARSDGQVIGEF